MSLQLKIFKKNLNKMLDDRGFEASNDVLNKIEESSFQFTRSDLSGLRTQIIQPLTQLSPANFLVGLRGFIDSLKMPESYQEIELYEYYIEYSRDLEDEIINHIEKPTKINLFLLYGNSVAIPSIHSNKIKKFFWFIEHLFPDYFRLANLRYTMVDCVNFHESLSSFYILGELANYLGIGDLEKDLFNKNTMLISIEINRILEKQSLIFPILVNKDAKIDGLIDFLNVYLSELENNIGNSKYPFTLVLMLENQKHIPLIESTAMEKIEISAIEKEYCKKWIQANRKFFKRNKELCANFLCNFEADYLPNCNTQEDLFMKINANIFPYTEFKKFLEKGYYHIKEQNQ